MPGPGPPTTMQLIGPRAASQVGADARWMFGGPAGVPPPGEHAARARAEAATRSLRIGPPRVGRRRSEFCATRAAAGFAAAPSARRDIAVAPTRPRRCKTAAHEAVV